MSSLIFYETEQDGSTLLRTQFDFEVCISFLVGQIHKPIAGGGGSHVGALQPGKVDVISEIICEWPKDICEWKGFSYDGNTLSRLFVAKKSLWHPR